MEWHDCYYVTFLILTEMVYLLSSKNDHDFYKRVVDPNWIEMLDVESSL